MTLRSNLRAAAFALALAPAGLVAQQATPDSAVVVSLERAVELAVRRDPAAVAAEASVRRARADLLQARGTLLPSLNVNGSYANSSNERFDQTTGRLVSESYAAQVQAGYDVFTGGRRLAENRAAGALEDAAEARYRAQRFATVLSATQAFYATAAAADLVAVAESRLERAQKQQEFAETRLELGTATRSDALRAGIEVANSELAVEEARAARRAASLELGRVVGVAGEVVTEDEALPDSAPELPATDELVTRALRSAPEVVAAEKAARGARMTRLASLTGYLPTVRLTGGYDWFAFQFPPDQRTWSMRLFASLPLFNNFQREAAVQRASAAQELAQAQAGNARIAAQAEVETAAQDVELASRRVEISTRTLSLAREDLRVQEERYRIGNATILDLQTSQVALAEAEVARVRARQSLGVAVAELEAVLGEKLGED